MKSIVVVLLGLTMLFFFGCQQKVDTQADVEAITKLMESIEDAWNTNNIELALAKYTDDAIVMPQNGVPVAVNYGFLKTNTFDVQFTYDEIQVNGDMGYVRLTNKGTWKANVGGKSGTMNSKALHILRKQSDGTWKISHLIWNRNEPQFSRAAVGDTVWVLLNHVKADKRDQFEDFVQNTLIPTAEKASQTDSKYASILKLTRTLYPTEANEDGTYTYIWLMDPPVSGADYSFKKVFNMVYSPEEAEKYIQRYRDAVSTPQVGYTLIQKRDQL